MVAAAGPPRHGTAPQIGSLHTLHLLSPSLALGFHPDFVLDFDLGVIIYFVRVERDLDALLALIVGLLVPEVVPRPLHGLFFVDILPLASRFLQFGTTRRDPLYATDGLLQLAVAWRRRRTGSAAGPFARGAGNAGGRRGVRGPRPWPPCPRRSCDPAKHKTGRLRSAAGIWLAVAPVRPGALPPAGCRHFSNSSLKNSSVRKLTILQRVSRQFAFSRPEPLPAAGGRDDRLSGPPAAASEHGERRGNHPSAERWAGLYRP
jgi:hypothetical protein